MTGCATTGGHDVLENFGEALRVGSGRHRLALRAPQAGGGDHVHRPRDLADVLNALDAASNVAKRGHDSLLDGEEALEFLDGLLQTRNNFFGEFLAITEARDHRGVFALEELEELDLKLADGRNGNAVQIT